MAQNNLKILITGTLNAGATIGEINTAIKGIEKRINSIKLKVEIDDKISKTLADFSKAMEQQKKITQELNRVIKEEKVVTKEADGTIKEKIRQHLKSGEIIEKETTKIKQQTQATQKQAEVTGKLASEIERLGNVQKKVTSKNASGNVTGSSINQGDKYNNTTSRFNSSGQLTSQAVTENIKQQQLAVEKLRQKMLELNNAGILTNSSLSRLSSALNTRKTEADLNQITQALNRIQNSAKTKEQNKELEKQLELYRRNAEIQATRLRNTHTGTVNNAGLDAYLRSVRELNTATPQLQHRMRQLSLDFREVSSQAQVASRNSMTFGQMLSTAMEKFPVWMMASTAFYLPIQTLSQLIDTLYVLDERLVSIDKVLENADMSAVFENATKAAETYGQTIDGVLESLGEISKLGFNQQDAEFLNNQSMLLSTVGEFKNNADAANYLVAIMRQYKLEVEDTAQVVDALNHVSNKTGADTVSLSQGLSKASSSAAMAGVSFHELNGMIANTQEVLKISGNEAGTFYKTLFTRFLRPKTQSMLESVGIATKDMNGELLSATTVLSNLGKQWEQYDSQTQNAIASQLGGVWHVNKVTSLLENQDNVLKNIEYSMGSYGSATTELETFQEGLRYQTNQMIASFQELGWTIGEVGVRDFILLLVEGATSLIKGFTELTKATDGWNIKLPLLAAGIYGTVKAVGALRLAGIGLKASFGWIGLGVVALETLASVFMKSSTSSTESAEAFSNNAKQMSDQTKQLEYLISKYNQLSPLAEDNKDKQQELQTVLSEIQRIAPHLIESTGEYGDALYLNKTKADEYIKSLKAMTDEQVQQAKLANDVELANVNVNIDEEQKKLDKLDKKVKDTFENISSYQSKYNVSGLLDAEEDFDKRFEKLQNSYSQALKDKNTDLVNSISQQLSDVKAEYDQYISDMETSDLGKYSETFGNVEELKAQRSTVEERQKALDQYTSSAQANTNANNENASSLSRVADGSYDVEEGFEDAGNSAEKAANALEVVGSTAKEIISNVLASSNAYNTESNSIDENTDSKYENMSATEMAVGMKQEDIDKSFEMVQVYRFLSAQEQLSESQKYALATATNFLANTYPHLINGHEMNIDAMLEEAKSNNILIKAVEAAANGQLTAQEAATVGTAVATKSRIETMKAEMAGLNKLLAAYGELADASYDTIFAQVNAGLLTPDVALSLVGVRAGIEQRQAEITRLSESLNGITLGLSNIPAIGGSSGSGGSGQSDADKAAEEAARQKEQAIKDIISLYKDGYKMLQDVAVNEINAEKEAFEQAHEAKMKAMDEQLALYEDIINKQIESIDKQEEEYNWNKRLSDSQSDRQDIINEMNELQLDNSFSAKKRMDELRVRLAEIDSGISDMQHEREVELRKENLQSLLENKRLQTEQEKTNAQSSYDTDLAHFDTRIGWANKFYENLINDNRAFQEIADKINAGNTASTMSYLNWFTSQIGDHTAEIGESISTNFIDAITRALAMLSSKNYGGSVFPTQFHEGGIVGVSSSPNRLTEMANKLFNVKPGEQVIKSLVGELQVPPKNIPNLFTNINSMVGSLLSNRSVSNGGNPLTIQFNVAKMTGSESDVNRFMTQIVKGVNALGGNM